MKLFILSDIHGSEEQCQKVLKIFSKSKADYLVILGDILYHGPRNPLPASYNPQAVYELLNPYSDQIIAVRGNCDSEVDQMVLEFSISDDYTFLALKGRLVYLSHGHIYNPETLPPGFDSGDVFLFGHIHLPLAERVNDYYLGNPGSITFPKENFPSSYGILSDESFVIYDLDEKPIKELVF